MNLNHLAIFQAVADAGNITAGAERLHISQPAVSKQLQELERSLGAPLLDRLPRGVRLTEAGELLAGYARRLFALEAEAELALAELKGLERGSLSIGASVTIGSYLLPQALARFYKRYPGLELSVEIANTESIQRKLLDGALDIGLTEGQTSFVEIEADEFRQDELVAIAAPTHPLAQSAASVTIQRLCEEPFVVREPGSGTRLALESALAERQLTIRPAMSLGNIEAIKRAVAAGIGVAFVSALTIEMEVAAGSLAVIELADFTLRRPFHIAGVRGRHRSRAAQAFLTMLRDDTKPTAEIPAGASS